MESKPPPGPNHLLLASSCLSTFTAAFAASRGLYGCAALVSAVFVSSVVYWARPVHGPRRNVDIVTVMTCLVYQALVARRSTTAAPFAASLLVGGACYVASCHCTDAIASDWLHVGVHVAGNVGNVILYIGLSPTPQRVL